MNTRIPFNNIGTLPVPPWDMTLGDFKKMGCLTDQEIKLLQSEPN